MDDLLLIISIILLAPAVYFAWPWLKGISQADDIKTFALAAPDILGSSLFAAGGYLLAAICTQLGGRYVRNQEKLSLAILDEIGYNRKPRISELSSRLGMSETKVQALVNKLIRIPSLNINQDGDRIVRCREKNVYRNSRINRTAVKDEEKDEREIPQDLKDFVANRSGANLEDLINSRMEGKGEEENKNGCLYAFILIILFMTPLWPVALIMIIRKSLKKAPVENSNR